MNSLAVNVVHREIVVEIFVVWPQTALDGGGLLVCSRPTPHLGVKGFSYDD